MKKNQFNLLYFFIIFFILLSLLIASRLIFLKDEATMPPIVQGIVLQDVDVVTIHSEPSQNTHVITVVNNEEFVEVLDSVELNSLQWYRVKTTQETGWLLAENLTIIESDEYQPAQ